MKTIIDAAMEFVGLYVLPVILLLIIGGGSIILVAAGVRYALRRLGARSSYQRGVDAGMAEMQKRLDEVAEHEYQRGVADAGRRR